jgi:hypothetical protein
VAKKIDLRPETLDLELYAGDGANLKLTITDNSGGTISVDGEITAQIRKARLDANHMVEFAANLNEAESGVVVISLTGEQTATLIETESTFEGFWDVQWKSSGKEPITLIQGRARCHADVTR